MGREVGQRELRNDSGEIVRAAEAGETITVTRNGVPVAELRPLRRRQFVPFAEAAASAAHLPNIDPEAFRRDVDRLIDQSVE